MILRQYLRFEPAVSASYLVGCAGKAVGAVIDPVEPAEFYLEEAARNGVKLRYVLDTHLHADHLSTGRETTPSAAGAVRSAYRRRANRGQAVGNGLRHDGVVVVVLGAEAVAQLTQADTGGDGEAADVIGQAALAWRHEVGQ